MRDPSCVIARGKRHDDTIKGYSYVNAAHCQWYSMSTALGLSRNKFITQIQRHVSQGVRAGYYVTTRLTALPDGQGMKIQTGICLYCIKSDT
jgi:hypothetical protein